MAIARQPVGPRRRELLGEHSGLLVELGVVLGPASRVPELDVVADADDHARAVEARVVDQVLGEPDPARRVERLVRGRGVEAPVHHPALAAEPVEVGEEAPAPVVITLRREDLDAGVEAGDENDPSDSGPRQRAGTVSRSLESRLCSY